MGLGSDLRTSYSAPSLSAGETSPVIVCALTPVISCCSSFQGREFCEWEGVKGGRQRVETGEGGWKCPFSKSHFCLSERVVVRTKKYDENKCALESIKS